MPDLPVHLSLQEWQVARPALGLHPGQSQCIQQRGVRDSGYSALEKQRAGRQTGAPYS